ncbi:Rho GTPase [Balamuthia mandrillaris]
MEANEQVQTATKQEAKPRFKGSKRKLHSSDLSTPSTPPRPNKKTSKRQREGKEEEGVGHEFVSVWERNCGQDLHCLVLLHTTSASKAALPYGGLQLCPSVALGGGGKRLPSGCKQLCPDGCTQQAGGAAMGSRANGLQCPWSETSCTLAAENGRLEVLKWARANGCPWDEYTCVFAAKEGHMELLQWARAHGCPWDELTCAAAAYGGHLAVLKWARANGCPWNEDTCTQAAQEGHMELLQWARSNGCLWGTDTFTAAASRGCFEVLGWLSANECPWNILTCSRAAERGHLEVLKWLRANGCPWDKREILLVAKVTGHNEMKKWVQCAIALRSAKPEKTEKETVRWHCSLLQSKKKMRRANETKCLVVGDAGVGKTCLLARFVQNRFPTDYIPTVYDNYENYVLAEDGQQHVLLSVWDTRRFFGSKSVIFKRYLLLLLVFSNVLVLFFCTLLYSFVLCRFLRVHPVDEESMKYRCGGAHSANRVDVFLACFSVATKSSFASLSHTWIPNVSYPSVLIFCSFCATTLIKLSSTNCFCLWWFR